MKRSEYRKSTSLNNQMNMKEMGSEARSAKEAGVSYGKLKANMGPDFEESDYPVSTREFVRASDKRENVRTAAFIK
ncbi:MAG: hypothetical protein J6I68_16970 [Butyrivibrio sp.]|uniref:hypothetical protein n=1 Tax=Butyrivibrio sp. TaxID=28121 RepID=UPI001B6F304A|nr:hypothetical protein [Butyrivibrio sp.]MBP3784930.1 hypothetical protein [Butyrivibrio sp.]